MGKFIAEQTVKQMSQAGACINGSCVNVLGLTFKEDCPDLRNSRVPDIIRELETYGCKIAVHDPLADPEQAQAEYGIALQPWDDLRPADAVIVAVAHSHYKGCTTADYTARLKPGGCLMDIKCILDPSGLIEQGVCVWRL